MVAARWDAQGTANTGMVFMRSNRRTKLLMDSVVNLFPIKGVLALSLILAVSAPCAM